MSKDFRELYKDKIILIKNADDLVDLVCKHIKTYKKDISILADINLMKAFLKLALIREYNLKMIEYNDYHKGSYFITLIPTDNNDFEVWIEECDFEDCRSFDEDVTFFIQEYVPEYKDFFIILDGMREDYGKANEYYKFMIGEDKSTVHKDICEDVNNNPKDTSKIPPKSCDGKVWEMEDPDYLLELLTTYMEINDEDISVFADSKLTKELLNLALINGYDIKMIELDSLEYDGAYLISLGLTEDNYEIWIEKAMTPNGNYVLSGDDSTFIQENAPGVKKYISQMDELYSDCQDDFQEYMYMFKMSGDEIEDEDMTYEYENIYEGDDGIYAEISVSSNVKDFVNTVGRFFDDYFE